MIVIILHTVVYSFLALSVLFTIWSLFGLKSYHGTIRAISMAQSIIGMIATLFFLLVSWLMP